MALTNELLKVLDNEEEPLAKRLKIADNAFKAVELPILHREAFLLKWLGATTECNDSNIWSLLLSWLTSQQMYDLSRNDISREDFKNLMNFILKGTNLKDNSNWSTILSCVVALVENPNFQLLFKYNLEAYCKFISKVLSRIDDEVQFCDFLKNEHLFARNLVANEEFSKHFLLTVLSSLGHAVSKFKNANTFAEISKVVEKCLFRRNFKTFTTFYAVYYDENQSTNEKLHIPKSLMKSLRKIYKEDVNADCTFKLIFQAYCTSYSNNFDMVYKFFALIVGALGFDVANYLNVTKIKKFHNQSGSLEKSIRILTGVCEALTKKHELNHKINKVTLGDFIQNLTTTVISLTKHPNKDTYEFLQIVILINPLVVEKILNDLLVYVMLSKTVGAPYYGKFLVSVFEVFDKLHRITNLIAKMIPILKTALEGDFKPTPHVLNFVGTHTAVADVVVSCANRDLIPNEVLVYFTKCITSLASWQVMNLFKTLIFHLDNAVKTDLPNTSDSNIIYIKVISMLMFQFLSSVRIAEHTVPTVVVEKFVKAMDDCKEVLGKFGNALVIVEHNATLMRSYLNICYAWGELYINLVYYSINDEVKMQKVVDNDSSACNITYLHPYLTRDQWCLISQRIANFGEKPCKTIMYKLYIQKLRALLLFEETLNEDTVTSIRTSILSSIDENWKDMITDSLVLNEIVSKTTSLSQMADMVLQDILESNNYEQLTLLLDNHELIAAILYTCLYKINKTFKKKHKKMATKISLSSKIFSYFDEEIFLSQKSTPLLELNAEFIKEFSFQTRCLNVETNANLNEKIIENCLKVVETLPVVQYDNSNIQHLLIVYLMSLLLDLQSGPLQKVELIEKCENIIIGLAQNFNASFAFLIEPFSTIQIVIEKFPRHLEFFTYIVHNIFKYESDVNILKSGIDYLRKKIKHEKYLECLIVILNNINKYKKSKMTTENKNLLAQYQEDIYKSILDLIKIQDAPNINLTETLALALNYSLTTQSDDILNELLPFFDPYIEELKKRKNVKGAILLFTTILRNRTKLKSIQENIVTDSWNYCRHFDFNERDNEEYSKLVILIFEHIPNEQFSAVADDLLKLTIQTVNENDIKRFGEQLQIWNAILSCNFNPTKNKMWQKVLESLMETLLDRLNSDKEGCCCLNEDVVRFQINIIQNVHLLLTGPLIESILLTISIITSNMTDNFINSFDLSISLLEMLMKFRKSIIMDYIPSYLQRYRALLNNVCVKSNSDLKLEPQQIQHVSDCAHKLEKLTKSFVTCNRHFLRISPYLIADILKNYEEITLYPNVKIHLNNCLYSLLSLCDQHAISYLMRILSTASTEMFKVMYDNYKKYYKFTGKV